LILALLIAGLGGQRYRDVERLQPEALVIVLDASSSMTAEDFSPENRLAAAKSNLAEYISANSDLEIGLIQFAASPQLLVPVTRDLQAVRDTLETVRQAEHGEDGTAIGSGIASAVNRLRRGAWSHRRILLITDGVNNRGAVAPLDAARIAATLGIVVDAVGIGTGAVSRFWAPSAQGLPVQVEAQIDIDDMALEELAHETGGSYRRVEDSDELSEALSSLGRLQTTTASERIREFDPRWLQMFMVLAITMICLEFIFSRFTLRELPGL
jgi:Ca-activated chloride channel family protein